MAKTENFEFDKPDISRNVDEEFYALQSFMEQLDALLAVFLAAITEKSPLGHQHQMQQVIGLVNALTNKMAADKTFKISELSDVLGANEAAVDYILGKTARGFEFRSAAALLGNHGHPISGIVGLEELLARLADEIDSKSPDDHNHTIAQIADLAQTLAALTEKINRAGAPVGSVLMVYGDDSSVPPGYLLMTRAPVTSTYPELRAFGLSHGWEVDANGDPLMPPMGGRFPRAWQSGQTVDGGRAFGSVQEDALQNIKGTVGYSGNGLHPGFDVWTGPFSAIPGYRARFVSTGGGGATDLNGWDFDASRVARTADETRPANITFTFWIKAYAADTDPGSIDLAQLTHNINAVSVRAAAIEVKLRGYTSAPQTITSGGQLVLAHGLGAEPRIMVGTLQFVAPQNNYAIGDKINVNLTVDAASTNYGMSAKKDGTRITIRFTPSAACFSGYDATTGASIAFANANLRLIVEAFA